MQIQPRFKVSTDQPARIGEADIRLAGKSLMLSPVYGHYEQTWIQIK